ncbi:hypothetical protein [Streptomyces malaysiensis]|uniref:MFS transporter n=1 Tax=Streptomyces malaysiensis subsp. samsunensis TaxID=459658 RepID=A0A9X2LX29_STRMQ|nr:hypothetical protein [Streptomyces samsunensis]MCQ8831571.1 hypothetical protein [Streptomyces samsunensis]
MRQYAELFHRPGLRQAEFFSVLGRFGYVACGLGALFLGTARLGIGVGGLGAGGLMLGVAVGSPVAGRLSARYGTSAVYAAMACVSVPGTALALAGAGGRSVPSFVAGCCVIGMTTPPIGAAMRALWPRSGTPERLRGTANSLESVVTEMLFVVAPPVTGVLAAIHAGLALAVADGCVVVGAVGFSCTRLVRECLGPDGGTRRRGSSREVSLPVAWLVGVGGVTAAVTGAMDVSVVSVLGEAGDAEAAGFVLLAPALASVLSGTAYGLLPTEAVPGRRFGRLLLVWVPLFALVALQSDPWLLAGTLFLAGIPMAAIGIEEFNLLSRIVASEARLQEVFTWASASANTGVACGNALGGYVAEHAGSSVGSWIPAAAVATACGLYFAGALRFRREMSDTVHSPVKQNG